jgi:hypothetical protein
MSSMKNMLTSMLHHLSSTVAQWTLVLNQKQRSDSAKCHLLSTATPNYLVVYVCLYDMLYPDTTEQDSANSKISKRRTNASKQFTAAFKSLEFYSQNKIFKHEICKSCESSNIVVIIVHFSFVYHLLGNGTLIM